MEIMREYVNKGHTYDVILDMLLTHHGINISPETLKAQLKESGLRRRGSLLLNKSSQILSELHGPGQIFGYRTMQTILKQKHELHVKMEMVMMMLCELNDVVYP